MTWLVAFWPVFKKDLAAAWAFIARYPWPAACIALTVFALWLWIDRADIKADLISERQGRKADQAEWERKVEAAKAATAKAEQDAREVATDAQETHDALASQNAGLEQYIRDHRLPAQQCAGRSSSAGGGDDTAVPADAAPLPVVAISEPDLRSCDAAYVYSRSAYDFTQGLVSKGLAVEGK